MVGRKLPDRRRPALLVFCAFEALTAFERFLLVNARLCLLNYRVPK